MGLFDGIVGQLGSMLENGGEGQSSGIVGTLLQNCGVGSGDIGGTLESLAANGLADQVASWTNNGQNLPVSPDQIRAALGNEQVQQMAQNCGLPVQDFLQHLASHLPAAASDAAGVTS
jgi:uncharacterized protein YidB (DUF937 family)